LILINCEIREKGEFLNRNGQRGNFSAWYVKFRRDGNFYKILKDILLSPTREKKQIVVDLNL